MNLPMSAVFLLVLVLLWQFVLFHSIEETDSNGRPDCPAFPCKNLGDIGFPYTQSDRPECGLFLLDGCEGNFQKVQLEKGGRWYQLNTISQANTITISDQVLAKQIESKDCESLKNLSLPHLPYVSFEILSKLSLCRCNIALNMRFPEKFSYSVCQNYTIYYNLSEGTPKPADNNRNNPFSSLCNCPFIQLPFTNIPPNNNSQHNNHLFELLTPNISVQVHISPYCLKRYYRGGQCLVNKRQNFQCSESKKFQHVWLHFHNE